MPKKNQAQPKKKRRLARKIVGFAVLAGAAYGARALARRRAKQSPKS